MHEGEFVGNSGAEGGQNRTSEAVEPLTGDSGDTSAISAGSGAANNTLTAPADASTAASNNILRQVSAASDTNATRLAMEREAMVDGRRKKYSEWYESYMTKVASSIERLDADIEQQLGTGSTATDFVARDDAVDAAEDDDPLKAALAYLEEHPGRGGEGGGRVGRGGGGGGGGRGGQKK